MARIAFFTEKLPNNDDPISEFSYDLMLSLADQQHELLVLSTFRPGTPVPATHPRIKVLMPFTNWGWLEVPKALPLLLDFQPDILHFIQPRSEALRGYTNAMSALPALAPLIGRPAVVTSFYDLNAKDISTHHNVILSSDAATVMNELQKDLLEKYFLKMGKYPEVSVLPAPLHLYKAKNEEFETHMEGIESFFQANKKIIFVPGDLIAHLNLKALFLAFAEVLQRNQDTGIIFGGSWSGVPIIQRKALMNRLSANETGSRVFVSGPMPGSLERFCLERCTVTFIAAIPPESLYLSRVLREALQSAAPLVMNSKQAELTALAWENKKHAFIVANQKLDDPVEVWAESIDEALNSFDALSEIKMRLPEFARRESADLPGNVMSRVYAKLMASKNISAN